MQILIIGGFLVAALINFLPVMGVIGAPQLERMYGIAFEGPDLAVLMRHRALLFGIIGALLVAAAFVPSLRWTAFFAGMVSMVSFLVFQALEGGTNVELGRVALVDYVGIAALTAAGVAVWMRAE